MILDFETDKNYSTLFVDTLTPLIDILKSNTYIKELKLEDYYILGLELCMDLFQYPNDRVYDFREIEQSLLENVDQLSLEMSQLTKEDFQNHSFAELKTYESYGEWLQACKGGEPASCNFDFAQYITEFVQLGNLAIQSGGVVRFDPVKMSVAGNAKANELLRIPYQNGWKL